MEARTHLALDPELCGRPTALAPGRATVELTTGAAMAADDRGLVHGGFVFGLADHAAMLAVNEPTVVLGAAETRFLAPAVVGDRLLATAVARPAQARKIIVDVEVTKAGEPVFTGVFTCIVPASHVLDRSASR